MPKVFIRDILARFMGDEELRQLEIAYDEARRPGTNQQRQRVLPPEMVLVARAFTRGDITYAGMRIRIREIMRTQNVGGTHRGTADFINRALEKASRKDSNADTD